MSKKTGAKRITLTFDLFELPTAQHRAGLAGLIIEIDSMGPEGNKRNPRDIPVIEELTPTSATITFTPDSMQGIFNDLYAAKLEQVVVANKWPGTSKPKPGKFFVVKRDPKTGEPKEVPGFAYDVVKPQAPFIARHLQSDAQKPWLELWQQMIWSIPRGGNNVRSRAPFNETAEGHSCGDGSAAWEQIQEFQEKRAKSQFKTAPISGALLLGAQAVNAEAVPFAGRVDQNLLLHFWQVVVLTFVPQAVNKKDAKIERLGYVLTIPDVSDLCEFRQAFPEILGGLTAEKPDRTPAAARVDLPAQANLEVLRKLRGDENQQRSEKSAHRAVRRNGGTAIIRENIQTVASGKALRKDWTGSVRAVESYHMIKMGNNIKMLSFSRVGDRPRLVAEYERIERTFRNPLFRAAQLRALIEEKPWHGAMLELFAEYPSPFFIEGTDTPKFLPRFGRDASAKLRAILQDLESLQGEPMTDEIDRLSSLVQKLIWTYVVTRTNSKRGIELKDPRFKRTNDKGKVYYDPDDDYRAHWKRVCSDVFLSMRSRHDQDFVEYFSNSICSVPQKFGKLSATTTDIQFLSKILIRRSNPSPTSQPELCWQDLKALAMVAVSACSSAYPPRSNTTQGSQS